jgi:hypothetical protein
VPLETGLRTLLLAEPTITSLVPAQAIGGTTYPSIFNEHPKRKAEPPYILIRQTTFDPYVCLDGTSGLASYEFEIDCVASEVQDSIAIGSAVSGILKDYSGPAGASDTIKAVIWQNKRMEVLQEDEGRDVQRHAVVLSFQIQAT